VGFAAAAGHHPAAAAAPRMTSVHSVDCQPLRHLDLGHVGVAEVVVD